MAAAHIVDMAFIKKVVKKKCNKESNNKKSSRVALVPVPHYPSMPSYRPSHDMMDTHGSSLCELNLEVIGMECGACAGSIEKSVKRLPGIEEATVSVLQNRAQVIYNPSFIHVSKTFISLYCDTLKKCVVIYG